MDRTTTTPTRWRRRAGSVAALAAILLAPGVAKAQLRGRWLGQDGKDFVGPNSAEAPSGVQDIHIQIGGLPKGGKVEHVSVRGLGGDEWQYNGPNGPWRAHLERKEGSPTADLYLEPTRPETGRGFTINVRMDDGSSAECIVEGGRADPNLRTASARLKARWVGQDGRDLAGPDASVGPDGVQDVAIALEGLTPNVEVADASLRFADGARWRAGVNPDALPNAEVVRSTEDRTRAELLFSPDKDRKGQALRVAVRYANGQTDAVEIKAGPADPGRRVATPRLPAVVTGKVAARWLGQGDDPVTGPGSVHVALSGLPDAEVVAAALTDEVGGAWVFKARDDVPFEAASYPMGLSFQPGPMPGSAVLGFAPIRDESKSRLTLRLRLADGRDAVADIPGGAADPGLRGGPGPDGSSVDAKPGDDLHGLVARFGTVRLAAGTYALDRPLVLERPVTLVGEPGAVLRFRQPGGSPPWTAAIKVHAGRTTLEGFAVRFDGPVRWAENISYGPAVIGTTDNLDTGAHPPKAGLVFRKLDLESPPASGGDWEEAARLFRLVTAENGEVVGNRLRGGMVEFAGGPWRIRDNAYRGTPEKTFSHAVFAGHGTHDLALTDNAAKAEGPSGKTWRFLVLTNRGADDLVADNRVEDVGPRDDDAIPQMNAPEIILTEAYRLRFEGRPLAASADRRVLAIPDPQGDPAEPGDALAMLDGPHAGEFVRVAQRIDRRTYLLATPLPTGVSAVSIASGFVGERFEGNRIDARGGSVAAGFVLVGNHFGTRIARNHVLGCGEAFRLTAAPTEGPGVWGWSHAPFLGVSIEGNTVEDSLRGMTIAVEHGPPVKSSRGRVYLSAGLKGNTVRWTPEFLRARGAEKPPAITIGDERTENEAELVVRSEDDAADGLSRGSMVVHAATLNGKPVRGRAIPLPAREAGR
jgi:hypothetical protein